MSEICQAPPPGVRPPRFRLPKGSTDTHFHVFGPVDAFPYQSGRSYTPDDALPATAVRLFAEAGIQRSVLVQPAVYGNDNSRHLSAATEMPWPTRVVVAVDTQIPDDDLIALHEKGARGVRRMFVQEGVQAGSDLEHLGERLSEIGWHIQLHLKPALLEELEPQLIRLSCPVVVEHMGMIDPRGGPSQPAFKALLRLLDAGNCYVKLSGYYRLSRDGAPYDDMSEMAGALLEAAPERLLWGSDWPHPAFSGAMPDLADLIDPLADWIPDEALRCRILVDNPAELYGFDTEPKHLTPGDL